MAKKQKIIKKQARTNKVKFGLKKLNFKKNWKKLSYLGLAGFLALTSVGYGVWRGVSNEKAFAAATYQDICFFGAPNSTCYPATAYYCKRPLHRGTYTVLGHIRNRSTITISNVISYFRYPNGIVNTTFTGVIPVNGTSNTFTFFSPGIPSVPRGDKIADCRY